MRHECFLPDQPVHEIADLVSNRERTRGTTCDFQSSQTRPDCQIQIAGCCACCAGAMVVFVYCKSPPFQLPTRGARQRPNLFAIRAVEPAAGLHSSLKADLVGLQLRTGCVQAQRCVTIRELDW
jgi:hypothetical protein